MPAQDIFCTSAQNFFSESQYIRLLSKDQMTLYGNVPWHCYKEISHTEPPQIRQGCNLTKPEEQKTCLLAYEYKKYSTYCLRGYKAPTSFEYFTETKTPTHDLTPYLSTKWSIYTTGSWVDVIWSLRNDSNYQTPNLSEFDKFFIHENLKLLNQTETRPAVLASLQNEVFALERGFGNSVEQNNTLALNASLTVLGPKTIEFENKSFTVLYSKGKASKAALELISIETELKLYVQFSSFFSFHVFSLQGILHFISLRSNVSFKLNMVWLHTNHTKDLKLLVNAPAECQSICAPECFYCLSFYYFKTSYMFFRKKTILSCKHLLMATYNFRQLCLVKSHYLTLKIHLTSWTEAHNLCNSSGADLPLFRSRDELDEFMSLIKLSAYIPPVEAAFIRTSSTTTKKVCVNISNSPWVSHSTVQQVTEFCEETRSTCHSKYENLMINKIPFYNIMTKSLGKKVQQLVGCWFFFQKWNNNPATMSFLHSNGLHMDKNLNYTRREITHCFKHNFQLVQQNHFVSCLAVHLQTLPNRMNYMKISATKVCAILNLNILSFHHVFFAPCSSPLLYDVFCTNKTYSIENTSQSTIQFCEKTKIMKNNSCFSFHWETSTNETQNQHCNLCNTQSIVKNMWDVSVIFDAVKRHVLLIYNGTHTIRYQRSANVVRHQTVHDVPQGSTVVTMLHSQGVKNTTHSHLFVCNAGVHISAAFLCDGTNDCLHNDALDENLDVCPILSAPTENCPLLFYKHSNGSCLMYIILDKHIHVKMKQAQVQHSILENIANIFGNFCYRKGKLSCFDGSKSCFTVSEICLYRLSFENNLTPCIHGEHMESCKDFECNVFFKCPGYHCIPWAYVCDGKWDCPFGYDESLSAGCSSTRVCHNLFKCRNSNTCIHLSDVCDGSNDCPHNHDELLCDLKGTPCPKACQCLLYAVTCGNITHHSIFLADLTPYYAVTLMNIKLNNGKNQSYNFRISSSNIHILVTINFFLRECCLLVREIPNLCHLNLTQNQIIFLNEGCFCKNSNLKVLSLKDNLLTKIHSNVFSPALELHVFDLRNNSLSSLSSNDFNNIFKVRILFLASNNFTNVHFDTFQNVKIETVVTENQVICCLVQNTSFCSATNLFNIDCASLIPTTTLKVMFYVVSAQITVFNILSTILQKMSSMWVDPSIVFAIIVVAVNLADFGNAIPLFVMWISDLVFHEKFILKREIWTSGLACYSHFCFQLFCSVFNSTSLCFFALSRLMVVLSPMTTTFKRTKFVLRSTVISALTAIVFSLGMTFLTWFFDKNHSLSHSLCSPFVDPTRYVITIQICTWITALFQISAAIFIVVVHSKLFLALKTHEKTMEEARTKQKSNTPALVQLVLFTLSSFFCWVPKNIIHLVFLFLPTYPTVVLIWVSVVVTPMNSVVNPLVFIGVSIRKIKKHFDKEKQKCLKQNVLLK